MSILEGEIFLCLILFEGIGNGKRLFYKRAKIQFPIHSRRKPVELTGMVIIKKNWEKWSMIGFINERSRTKQACK